MKEIPSSEVEKLLTIIQPAPLIRIGHFSDSGETLPKVLSSFCEQQSYAYLLNCTDQHYYTSMLSLYEDQPATTVKLFNLDRPNYMQHGKFYDYLFVSCAVADEQRVSFLQKSHKVIKNAGLILLFVQRSDYATLETWTQYLEEHYFVATSSIELGEDWQVIISKKMHGWGG
jgi:hypothetical protein